MLLAFSGGDWISLPKIHAYIIARRSSMQHENTACSRLSRRALAITVYFGVCKVMTGSVQNAGFLKKKVSEMYTLKCAE